MQDLCTLDIFIWADTMKHLALLCLKGTSVIIVIVTLAWFALPNRVATVLLTLNTLSAGLVEKTVETDIGPIHYLEGGQGETIVMVHGIYARKEHWIDLARHLVDEYHVIALDLPGFGNNAPLSDTQYLLDQQQRNLAHVFRALALEDVHIAANSMGAYVSVLLVAEHPEMAASLAFIGSPLGVPTPVKSDMDIARAQGLTPLVVQSATDFDARNSWLSPDMPYVPGPILNSWMQTEVAQADLNVRIWDLVHKRSQVPTVLALAPDLTLPSLIIWCAPDQIFHVSGGAVLEQALPHAHLITLDNCGHLPMLDTPKDVARHYADFLTSVPPAAGE